MLNLALVPGLEKAKKELFDVLIVDTAGRLHVDEELMVQLEKLKKVLKQKCIAFQFFI